MIRFASACVLMTALLVGLAGAGETNSPKLTKETKDAVQITQENIIKMKIRQAQPQPPTTPSLPLAPLSPPAPRTDG